MVTFVDFNGLAFALWTAQMPAPYNRRAHLRQVLAGELISAPASKMAVSGPSEQPVSGAPKATSMAGIDGA